MFLELDLQRVSRAFRNGLINQPTNILFFKGENKDGGGTITLESVVLAPQQLGRSSRGILRFLEKLTEQNPIQEMYSALEDRGIIPGEEVCFVSVASSKLTSQNRVLTNVFCTFGNENYIPVHHCC